MKNSKLILLMCILVANPAFAQTRKLTDSDKAEILRAIKILDSMGVLKPPSSPTGSVEIDRGVLEELMNEGLLKLEQSQMQVICTGL